MSLVDLLPERVADFQESHPRQTNAEQHFETLRPGSTICAGEGTIEAPAQPRRKIFVSRELGSIGEWRGSKTRVVVW
jgi:hypothetical protein